MTQKEKLFYYLDRINNSTELKDEIYWKCVNYVLQWRSGLYLHGMCGKW